ncbi:MULTISPECIES: hypothetical protein [Chryseobacterium]|uniref:DUF4259 domain-containing protein n=2 Tax=Chryseobacterium TaxID=59732 RepID=A0A543EN65_9FLAO|nr:MULTISPECIES: hypothetical protein [Chryseobacterium]MDR6457722.1 hypothetical protein [Chryseobacterium vietnamense]TQM23011.1 hypothetical protein FB551_2740 [Chryseobacterium aquifrigidense]
MGTWGTAISSNDTYADIYSEFFGLYNDGLDVAEISNKLIAENQEIISDNDDCNNFWFALAKAQWECKQLNKDIFDRVKTIIETGAELEVWQQLDADEKEIKKRKVVLDKFLADLETERPKAKSRKKKIIRQPVFEKGDCLTFKLENGNFGGAVVLEAIRDNEYGHNLIATTRINQSNKPTKKDFEDAEVLVMNFAIWNNKPNVKWYLPIRHKHIAQLIETTDSLEVQKKYDINSSTFGFVADFDIHIIQAVDEQIKSEETKPRSTTKLTIKELIKNKSRWKLW